MSSLPSALARGTRWRAKWAEARNRLIAAPRFQRWASAFPLTRRIAAGRAGELFDLCAGFVYSQILFACVEIDLFRLLAAGPQSAAALALRCGLTEPAMHRLLEAAADLDLVERREALFGLGRHGAACLGNSGLAAMITHHAMLYRDLADPLGLLRGATCTELSRFWSYAGSDASTAPGREATAPYTALMSASQAMIADDILDAYPFVEHGCLLDIGGGGGDFLVAAGHRRPDLRLMLFDLPSVADAAGQRFVAERMSGRAAVVGGDFRKDPLPAGADLVSLVRIVHDHDDATVLALLEKILAILPPGGILLLAEPFARTADAERVGAYFSFYLLAMGQGRPRTAAELTALLGRVGFVRVRTVPTPRPMLTGLLVAQKSAGPGNRAVRRH